MSDLTSIFSINPDSSVEYYKQRLKPIIDAAIQDPVPLDELVDAAEKIINENFAPNPQSIFKHAGISVQLDKIMIAMLACADECGGTEGTRYVAGAIVACSQEEDVIGALTHLLFIFKTPRGHEPSAMNDCLSRKRSRQPSTTRQSILGKGAVGYFDNDHTSNSSQSALTTFEILKKLTCLPEKNLQELHDHIDHPSNGMMLEINTRNAFDGFAWCLKKTEVDNVYDLKVFDADAFPDPANNRVIFVDHSEDFPASAAERRKRARCSFDLPNPVYLSIHAAIAEVLNMSGAGRFFDELLDKYKVGRGKVSVVRCWSDLEALAEEQLLRESVIQAFQSVQVR
ncbi:hypothetical protein M413DRAFT_27957 [Hebeloma cylindrosporum]|uniref:HNH nuclease domain-containing protein n=1 Tax=Hebeloma cylindrosporum TaxID=76867 RepID=A0A0C3CB32_HEBCY|nr:hypothetical protein M413DRAFT_27957 [Hebeloma cylindrosporum h7]